VDEALLRALHEGLTRRPRPEDVAVLCSRVLVGKLSLRQRIVIGRATRHSETRPGYGSMMSMDWERPVGAAVQVRTICELLPEVTADLAPPDPDDPGSLRLWADAVGASLGWRFDQKKLPNRQQASDAGWAGGRRGYVRRWKALHHLMDKAEILDQSVQRRRMSILGRTGMASRIPLARFEADPDAAAFIAYFAARTNVRRTFSLEGKANPMDEVAGMLFDRLCDSSDWAMVALLLPSFEAVSRLTDTQKGDLLAQWSAAMTEAATLLGAINSRSPVDREGMVVRKGNDSATWNLAAQAYNRARDSWMNVLASIDGLDLLDAYCPPKAMRLMAADLVYWMRRSGRDPIAPDVKVAARLPAPWDVISGEPCHRHDAVRACREVGVNPYDSGWAGPRAPKERALFEPTPEVVHGIIVGDPLMASILRRGGAFSGKTMSPELIELLDQLQEPPPGRQP
jgi:hypothetical protein